MRKETGKKETSIFSIATFFLGLLCAACNEEATTFGSDMMPASDMVTKSYRSYGVQRSLRPSLNIISIIS